MKAVWPENYLLASKVLALLEMIGSIKSALNPWQSKFSNCGHVAEIPFHVIIWQHSDQYLPALSSFFPITATLHR